MNRNVESHFSELPKVDIQRSMFDRSSSHKTSFNAGELIPFYVDEVLPGDTFNVKTSVIVRLQTPLTPIMDNIYMDTYYFFVPNRIVWSHWKEFMGENRDSPWIPQVSYSVPVLEPPSGGWNKGTIADYLGIPVGVGPSQELTFPRYPSALPFRAYAMICDQWFRDQNLTDPLVIPNGDSLVTGSNGNSYVTDVAKGGAPFKVSKYHDYFTSCLPAPQKGDPVRILNPITGQTNLQSEYRKEFVPVYTTANEVPGINTKDVSIKWRNHSSNVSWELTSAQNPGTAQTTLSTAYGLLPKNLWADISGMNITVNDLRLAFQLQRFYERNARAGTRYRELIREHFGIVTSDARMMIPEYLGGHRFPLSIHQVANQSQGESDFLGDLGAMSNTSDIHDDFVKSFEEHGFVIGVCCVRYDHSYPQGMERFWTRRNNLDYYYPVFANIGDQPVYKSEIYFDTANGVTGNEVFGYQEPWAEYRYKPSRVSSSMRPDVSGSLAVWHLADYYQSTPSLSDSWIREDKSNVDRVLSVQSSAADQIFCDFYVKNIATRPMPMYSIPGLIDHH